MFSQASVYLSTVDGGGGEGDTPVPGPLPGSLVLGPFQESNQVSGSKSFSWGRWKGVSPGQHHSLSSLSKDMIGVQSSTSQDRYPLPPPPP